MSVVAAKGCVHITEMGGAFDAKRVSILYPWRSSQGTVETRRRQ